MIWARKKTGEPVIRISSVTAAEEFLEKHHIFVVGLFEKFEVSACLLYRIFKASAFALIVYFFRHY